MGADGCVGPGVPAFLTQHDAALAREIGQASNPASDVVKAGHRHALPSGGFELVRVKAGCAHEDVGGEPLYHRLDDARERAGVCAIATSEWERHVHVGSDGGAGAELRGDAQLGMAWPP